MIRKPKPSNIVAKCVAQPHTGCYFTVGKEYPIMLGGKEDDNRWYTYSDKGSMVFINGDAADAREFFEKYFIEVGSPDDDYDRAMSIL